MNAPPPKDLNDGDTRSTADIEAAMKSDIKKIRMRASTARAARVAHAEADRIEGLRQAKNEKTK